ncbi:hypothetical protein L1987_02509 [Smallanthus sonchifolius]|uniref:Uncharacterized protein n=1 Tax=Smallanthus sonchifolius TaxID=185202 RepID=A0ACB9K821_9ASTR|nr:hypothetical protein L1987_02509 [Smallanthus sonchifolius]
MTGEHTPQGRLAQTLEGPVEISDMIELTPEGIRDNFPRLKELMNEYAKEARLQGVRVRLDYEEEPSITLTLASPEGENVVVTTEAGEIPISLPAGSLMNMAITNPATGFENMYNPFLHSFQWMDPRQFTPLLGGQSFPRGLGYQQFPWQFPSQPV